MQEQVDDQSVETYQEDSQVYEDYGEYGEDEHYAPADTSLPVQGYEQGKGGGPNRSIPLENIKNESQNGRSCFVCTLCGTKQTHRRVTYWSMLKCSFSNLVWAQL